MEAAVKIVNWCGITWLSSVDSRSGMDWRRNT
jgi:hypothetical protein